MRIKVKNCSECPCCHGEGDWAYCAATRRKDSDLSRFNQDMKPPLWCKGVMVTVPKPKKVKP